MKTIVIPDVHGTNTWERQIELVKDVEKIVFLGDYVDSFDVPNFQILDNFTNIIRFKQENPEKVVLLLGNHETSYLYMEYGFSCSGFRQDIAFDIKDLLTVNIDLFQNAYQENKIIFTHAGVHDGWFKYNFKGDYSKNIAEQLNNPKNQSQFLALHDVGRLRGGDKKVGGIFWCDKSELKKPLKGFTQVVGHTPVKKQITYVQKKSVVYFIDCKNKEVEPFIIEI